MTKPQTRIGIFTIQLIYPGQRYGRDLHLTNWGESLVEFYDARFDSKWHPGLGLFISRYRRYGIYKDLPGGLVLRDPNPDYFLNEQELQELRRWLDEHLP